MNHTSESTEMILRTELNWCVCSGDAGVSPAEPAESSARSVCGRPEALQLRQSAARPGLSAITQHALQLPRQELAARLTVTLAHTDSVMLLNRFNMNCVCAGRSGRGYRSTAWAEPVGVTVGRAGIKL